MASLSTAPTGRKQNPPKLHKSGGPRRGHVGHGSDRIVTPSAGVRRAIYSGQDRLGSYRHNGTAFEAFDRLGRPLGTFPTEREAIAAVDPEASR